MNTPKYSIVLPVLNGAETLEVTLPAMLKLDRDDVEWVISDNHSEDNTWDLLQAFSDPRLHVVQPAKRLPIGEHLEFAYLQAKGEWQGHLGDDDLLFPSRFTVLDSVIKDTNPSVLHGENVRYHWPDYPTPSLANTLDGRTFCGRVTTSTGKDFAAVSLNTRVMSGGGSWTVHRSIIDAVRGKAGYFSSPQHVEFFAMRAACAVAPRVAAIDLPLWVIGRHHKSAGSQALRPKGEVKASTWDWSFEDPNPWEYCPFQYKGYATISFDAALKVSHLFADALSECPIHWLSWIDEVKSDLQGLITNGQLPTESFRLFEEGLRRLAPRQRLRWLLHTHPLLESILQKLYRSLRTARTLKPDRTARVGPLDVFGWPHFLRGERVGIHSIVDVPRWVENTFPGFFPEGRLC
jgi:hypothetical protein